MAKYDRGTTRKIGQVMREYQEGEHREGNPRRYLAMNRGQAITMVLAEVRKATADRARSRAGA